MKWHEFIFSNEPRHRIVRHGVFWLLWWWYFFSTTWWLQSPYNHSGLWEISAMEHGAIANFIISLWMLLIHIIACYVVIGFLLPRYLLKAKYFKFYWEYYCWVLQWLQLSHFIYDKVFPLGESNFISFQTSTGLKITPGGQVLAPDP